VVEGFSDANPDSLSNEPSNKCSVEFPPDYKVVEFKKIHEQNRVIYMIHNSLTGMSQIGEVINKDTDYGTDKIVKGVCEGC
ncbi:hypothetical protein ACI3QN_13470, partial [Propionibacterium freudenreichii]|uniref:hypothetical protein n=1 Tax=Propionibacterium freudenreichii TaxID=1744 RepID=UPI0038549567